MQGNGCNQTLAHGWEGPLFGKLMEGSILTEATWDLLVACHVGTILEGIC